MPIAAVAEGVAEDVPHVLVGQLVVHDATRFAPGDDTLRPQQAQLVTHRRLADAHQKRQVAHAELLGQGQRVQDPRPGRVGQELEGGTQPSRLGHRDQSPKERGHVLRVKALHLAPVGSQIHICTAMHTLWRAEGEGRTVCAVGRRVAARGAAVMVFVALLIVGVGGAPTAEPSPATSDRALPAFASTAAVQDLPTLTEMRTQRLSEQPRSGNRGRTVPALMDVAARVYVPNEMSNTVSVIDPKSFAVIATIKVGSHPQHVTPDWDMRRLFVNDTGLTEIDPRTSGVTRVVPVAMPYNLYFTPDGSRAIVVAEDLDRLDFYERTTWTFIRSVRIPWKGIDHMDFSLDGSYLLATTEYTGRVVKIDTLTYEISGVLELGGLPIDVRLSPDGSVFYVTNQSRHGVSVIDPTLMKEIGFIPTGRGAHGLQLTRDGRLMYVSNRLAGSISVVQLDGLRVTTSWVVGGSPDMLQLSPDGKQLWTGNRFANTVSVIDTSTGGVLARIPVGRAPHGLTYFPQPGRFSIGHNGVYRD